MGRSARSHIEQVKVRRKAWPWQRRVDAADAKIRQINDEIYRNVVFSENSTIVLMRTLEKCIQDEVLHEAVMDLAEAVWVMREELEGIKGLIPDAIAGRQAELVQPPLLANSGIPLVREAAKSAHSYLAKLQSYCDDGTITTCMKVMEDNAQIRDRQ